MRRANKMKEPRVSTTHSQCGIKLRAAADQRLLIEDFVEKNERRVCPTVVASCFVLQFVMPLVIVWSYSKQRQ